jgi:formate C-acetyltransferase
VPIWGKASVSHTTLGFGKALRLGYKGLRAQIDERLKRGGLDEKGVDLLQAMLLCLDAAAMWHRRHIEALEELVADSSGGGSPTGLSGPPRTGYERVLANLRNVPENPPASFAEAVQSLWFMYAFQRLCGNWSGLGRLDEMLGPYLKADLASGATTLDEAREDLAHFWIKGTEWIGGLEAYYGGDAQHYQNVVLGGVDAEGNEVTNEVTYLVLDIIEELGISDYPVAVRLNARSPERLLRRIAEVQRRGGGIVSVYNEDVVIAALCKFGYPPKIARRYTNDGCWETLIPGETCFSYVPFDTLLCLQSALGMNPAPPEGDGVRALESAPTDGHDNGHEPLYATFDDLYGAFRRELAAAVDAVQRGADGFADGGTAPPIVSLMIDDCIERGRGYYDRGPRYVVQAPHAGGLANAADSLLAIRKLVYEDNLLTLPDLVGILRGNWEGREDLRQRVLRRFDFYGNDDAEADAMVRRIFDDYTEMVAGVKERSGVLRPAGLSTFGREIIWREHRKASADGHREGEFLATNFSPSPGAERNGPTAALRSYCNMDFTRLPNIGTLELKLSPSLVDSDADTEAIVSLLRAFVTLGGCYLNIDMVSRETLLDAQARPELHRALAVRISGWSARFVTLDRDWQDMIIGRTEHWT